MFRFLWYVCVLGVLWSPFVCLVEEIDVGRGEVIYCGGCVKPPLYEGLDSEVYSVHLII